MNKIYFLPVVSPVQFIKKYAKFWNQTQGCKLFLNLIQEKVEIWSNCIYHHIKDIVRNDLLKFCIFL